MKSYKGACLVACAGWLGLGLSTSASAADEGAPVRDILFAQAFRLDKPYPHTWQKEQPSVSAGYLLVLAVDPEFARRQQVAEPVLYVGNQIAERVNAGDVSGRMVILVPSSINSQGELDLDLQAVPIWFGAPELPERIDAAQVRAELDAALRKGAKPFPEQKVQGALRRGGKALRLRSREALDHRVAKLLEQYSPDERDLIRGLASTKL